ncbi:uncharacterized protein KY384_009174 [Bacidia gigantensis]|uniref:uncharacterized protein n=1 Tax=Bacidia gigantensis TaxID=2732470 RepID=UPI001D03A383|nr:uncharacterized protein KY384_009174 [Bacidia gigantensis]KAG8525530.1 hypothetical protein KY384_009174 [Bacidia gigantensis]
MTERASSRFFLGPAIPVNFLTPVSDGDLKTKAAEPRLEILAVVSGGMLGQHTPISNGIMKKIHEKLVVPCSNEGSGFDSHPNDHKACQVFYGMMNDPEIAQYKVGREHSTIELNQCLPTFIIFKSSTIVEKIRGADGPKLQAAVKKLVAEADSDGTGAGGFGSGSGGGPRWLPFPAPQGYTDVTDQVDVRGLDLLNSSSEGGGPRILFSGERPSGLVGEGKGKGKSAGGSGGKQEEEGKDWVESDTDEQLMLYIPFQSTLKVHTLHITSLPPKSPEGDGDGDEEIPMRPKNLRIYSNRANVLGFDEADGLPALQSVELRPEDWDEKTGSAKISLRFVKFQVVHSLILFVVDGEGEGEKVRVDRIRVVGETGEKRDPGKLEKVGEHDH